jgi:hypothetical protein
MTQKSSIGQGDRIDVKTKAPQWAPHRDILIGWLTVSRNVISAAQGDQQS